MYELSSPAHMHYEGSQEILLSSMLPFLLNFITRPVYGGISLLFILS